MRHRCRSGTGLLGSLGSLLIAIFVTTCGWSCAVRIRNVLAAPLGGALVGAGIAVMHFLSIGMMTVDASIEWDTGLVVVAVLTGMAFAAAGAVLMVNRPTRGGVVAAAGMLLAGVICMHFIAMAAMELVPSAPGGFADTAAPSKLLAVTIALAAIFVVSTGLAAAAIDLHLGTRRRAEALRMRALADSTFEGIAVVRDGILREMNVPLCEMLGLTRADLLGTPVSRIAENAEVFDALDEFDENNPVTCRLRRHGGHGPTVQVRARRMDFGGETSNVLVFRDVSSEEEVRARMTHLAHHDTLTGLPNRLKFRDTLEQELARAWRDDTMVAVVFFDLDRFKEVNDIHGHATGDELLKTVARAHAGLPAQAGDRGTPQR